MYQGHSDPRALYQRYPYSQSSQEYRYGTNMHGNTNNQPQHAEPGQYLCLYDNCRNIVFKRKADLQRHVAITHHRDTLVLVDCQHPGCHRKGEYGFTRMDKMIDHMRDVHGANFPKRASGMNPPTSAYTNDRAGYPIQQQTQQQTPVYLCLRASCGATFTRKADLERHVQVIDNRQSIQMIDCQEPGCHRRGDYGFTRKDKMIDHMREVHKAPILKSSLKRDKTRQGTRRNPPTSSYANAGASYQIRDAAQYATDDI